LGLTGGGARLHGKLRVIEIDETKMMPEKRLGDQFQERLKARATRSLDPFDSLRTEQGSRFAAVQT
jgi:hypothetical protein